MIQITHSFIISFYNAFTIIFFISHYFAFIDISVEWREPLTVKICLVFPNSLSFWCFFRLWRYSIKETATRQKLCILWRRGPKENRELIHHCCRSWWCRYISMDSISTLTQGSHVVYMLARSGVNHIRVIDFDNVTITSLNRHSCAVRSDIGKTKVDIDEFLEIQTRQRSSRTTSRILCLNATSKPSILCWTRTMWVCCLEVFFYFSNEWL